MAIFQGLWVSVLLALAGTALVVDAAPVKAPSPPPKLKPSPPKLKSPPPTKSSPPPKSKPPPPKPSVTSAISNLVVFGDSYSDTGRMRKLYPRIPNATLYSQGRFTNGPNYVDHVQAATKASVLNYAIAGGVMCDGKEDGNGNLWPWLKELYPKAAAVAGFDEQIKLFMADLAKSGSKIKSGKNVAIIW